MMKRAAFLTLSFIFSMTLLAQVQVSSPNMTQLTGAWVGHPNEQINLIYNKVPFTNRPLEMEIKTDSAGKFQIAFPFEERWPLDLKHGENSITFIIGPKDSINIQIKEVDLTYEYDFSGEGYKEAKLNYLNFRDFDFERQNAFSQIVQHTTPEQFQNTINTWKAEYRKVMDKNLKAVDPGSVLAERAETLMKVKFATYYLVYIKYKRDSQDSTFTDIPKSWKEVIKDPKLRTFDYTSSPEYQNFLFLYLTQMGPKPVADKCENFVNFAKFADSEFFINSKVEIMPRIILEATQQGCFKSVKTFYQNYLNYSTKPAYEQVMQQQIGEQLVLLPGEPAPDFDFVDAQGKTHRLEEFRGKVIYVDFWATWCGPCIRAMKSSGPLKEHFEGNENVAFVYISTDRDQNKWKNHYITNNGEPNHWHYGESGMAAASAYRVTSIPRYIIIDKAGNIVDANAPRPYDPTLIPILEEEAKKPYKAQQP